MKKGIVYTLVFMIVLSAVFTFALAFAYEAFKPNIAGHAELREQRAVLYTFGIEEGLTDDQAREKFQQVIKPGTFLGEDGYTYEEGGEVKGYAMPFTGAGLWGTIRGYLGVNADKSQTTGLVFTEQNETPGLGGRIDETWYREQFRGVPITPGQPLQYGQQADYKVDAITGATQTSSAVLRIVNTVIQNDLNTAEGK